MFSLVGDDGIGACLSLGEKEGRLERARSFELGLPGLFFFIAHAL